MSENNLEQPFEGDGENQNQDVNEDNHDQYNNQDEGDENNRDNPQITYGDDENNRQEDNQENEEGEGNLDSAERGGHQLDSDGHDGQLDSDGRGQLNSDDRGGQDDEFIINSPPQKQDIPRIIEGNYLKNKEILDKFFKNFSGEVQSYFSEFQQKQLVDTQQQRYDDFSPSNNNNAQNEMSITASDVPLVLRISFYYDNITFHPSETDKEELFNKPNSYKTILESLEKYFVQRKKITNFDPNSTKVTYSDFVEFSYFFLQNQPQLYLTQAGKEDEQWVDIQESPLERELKENIEKYEGILANKQISAQERQIALSTIESLKIQLASLVKSKNTEKSKPQGKTKAGLTQEQVRMKNLREAFNFYSKQQNVTGYTFTFDRIVHEQNVVNLACFMLFLKHFDILNKNKYVTKREVQIMFKKYSMSYKELDLETFKIMIEKVAIAFFHDEENISNIERVEKFYQHIQIDNPAKFQSKFQLLNKPFNILEKDGFRLLPSDQGRSLSMKKISPQLKERIRQHKEDKKMQSIIFQPTEQDVRTLEGHKASRSNENRSGQVQFQQSLNSQLQVGYSNKKVKGNLGKLDQGKKVSWQQLEQLSFSDMKSLNNGLFKPTDLFNENDDDEDKIYLAEYNLQEDKIRKAQESLMNKKGQENYGSIKETLRPSQRYMQKMDPNYGKMGNSQSVGNIHSVHGRAGPNEYYTPQPVMSKKQQAINASYQQRAHQVDVDQRMKEKVLMQNILNQNNQKIQRGMYAVNKNK